MSKKHFVIDVINGRYVVEHSDVALLLAIAARSRAIKYKPDYRGEEFCTDDDRPFVQSVNLQEVDEPPADVETLPSPRPSF